MQSNYSRRMEGKEVNLGGINFLIYPFGAFTAANLSGELTGMLLPAAGALAPLLGGDKKLSLDDDVLEATPQIAQAFSMVSGDKIEGLLKKLLCSKNIVLRDKGEYLTEEMADEIFYAFAFVVNFRPDPGHIPCLLKICTFWRSMSSRRTLAVFSRRSVPSLATS